MIPLCNMGGIMFSWLILSLAVFQSSYGAIPILKKFSQPKPVIAALMIEKDLSSPDKIQKNIQWAHEQMQVAHRHQMDGVLFEFRGGEIMTPPLSKNQYQAMLQVAQDIVKNKPKSMGVGFEILWHYPDETLRLAHESGADFVRLDFFSDEMLAKKKRVPIDPASVLRQRHTLKANDLAILTDIQVKYAQSRDPQKTIEQSAREAIAHGSDGVIVTATRSGEAPSVERVLQAKRGAAASAPVIIGSGFSPQNAPILLPHLDMIIVGTSISKKTGGPLVESKVAELMRVVSKHRQSLKK